MKLCLILILLFLNRELGAQKVTLNSFNMKVALPSGWTLNEEEGGYGCYSPTRESVILMMEDPDHSIEYYNSALISGVDIGAGTIIRTDKPLIPLSSSTAYSPILIITSNGNANGWGGLKTTSKGGVIGLVAISNSQYLEDVKSKMLSMLSSFEEVIVEINPEILNRWAYTLTSNHLEGNFSSYSSGYSGDGYTSSSSYDFCPNGSYRYTSEFSSTLAEPGVETEFGIWRLGADAGNVILFLRSNKGNNYRIILAEKGGVIYFNKTGYQRIQSRPFCQ